MTQPPPDHDAYEAEVRRRIETANYPAAPPSPPPFGGYAGTPSPAAPNGSAGASPHPPKSPVVAVVVTLGVVAMIAGGIFSFVMGANAGSRNSAVAASTSPAVVETTGEAAADATARPTPDPTTRPTKGPTAGATEDAVGPPFASRLDEEGVYNAYTSMKTDGSIYEIIPDTDDGRRYFKAFMFALIDAKAAKAFGGVMSADQRTEFIEREQHFLALEDLDLQISIKRDDGTVEKLNGLPPADA